MVKHANRVFITNFLPTFRIHRNHMSKLVDGILKKLGVGGTSISLVFVSDAQIKRLNWIYLNHSWATDVLAFPFSKSQVAKKAVGMDSLLGEVIISPERARIYSKRVHTSFEEELARYICHGILHLKGYSDRSHRARSAMERAENRLLKSLAFRVKRII